MKQIEAYADKKHCELCGAVVLNGQADRPERPGAEVIRRLAFIADTSPALALLMIHHIAGRTERQIAKKMRISHQAVHKKLTAAKRQVAKIMP